MNWLVKHAVSKQPSYVIPDRLQVTEGFRAHTLPQNLRPKFKVQVLVFHFHLAFLLHTAYITIRPQTPFASSKPSSKAYGAEGVTEALCGFNASLYKQRFHGCVLQQFIHLYFGG